MLITCLISICMTISLQSKNKSYSFFIEFENVNGIREGTPIRLRGLEVGLIQSIKIKSNSILTLAKISSNNVYIPRDSIIETNQTGLLNQTIIDIIPLNSFNLKLNLNPLSTECYLSSIICNGMYLEGDRGLNYDDLIRSTTRISQRFDDPRFFNLFYIFLQNSIELSDTILEVTHNFSDVILVFCLYFQRFLSSNFLEN
uniref:Mce/MlaD domain-containing protein n=1 Tax=Rhodogorgon sp. TaxID=2485824 RepID=A0A3G3MI65_9FLOR|nr:hypothetical protein [Rhodogorgon sp.]